MSPSVRLNALKPVQVGPGVHWYIRAHPVLVVRPQDMTITAHNDGSKTAAVAVRISYPYAQELFEEYGEVWSRNFNSVNPNNDLDAACACFYGEVEFEDEDPDGDEVEEEDDPADPDEGLGSGTVTAPGVYDPEKAEEELLKCNNPRKLPLEDFAARGRIVVLPPDDPAVTLVTFRLYVIGRTGVIGEVPVRFVASRTIFGAAHSVYGTTEVHMDDHTMEGQPLTHTIRPGTGGHGLSARDDDGTSTTQAQALGRRVDHIAPAAGPAIFDVVARYPLNLINYGFQNVTRDVHATRLR